MSAVSVITLVADADATKHRRRPRRKHRVWVMKYLRTCECYGAYSSLLLKSTAANEYLNMT